MPIEFVLTLVANLGILALCALFIAQIADFKTIKKIDIRKTPTQSFFNYDKVLIGVTFGATCAILILAAHHTPAGSVIDTRAAPAILSGIIGGPIAAVITSVFGVIARYSIGGPFVIGGSFSVILYAMCGLFLGRWMKIRISDESGAVVLKFIKVSLACTFFVVPTFFMDQDLLTSTAAAKTVLPSLFIQNLLGVLLLAGALMLSLRSVTDRRRLRSAIEALPEAFVLYDAEDRLVICNKRYKEVYKEFSDIITEGTKYEDILRAAVANGLRPDAQGREEEWLNDRLEIHRNPDGPVEHELAGNRFFHVHEVQTEDGETVGFRTEITTLKRQQQILEKQTRKLEEQASELRRKTKEIILAKKKSDVASVTDELTGVGNRRGLNAQLSDIAKHLSSGSELVVMMVDLDHFKSINDMYGHAVGDYVLRYVAQILKDNVQSYDYVARIGGDEFVIATTSPEGRCLAETIAQRIIDDCQKPVTYEGKELRFGASIGIAITKQPDSRKLIEDADIALYQAKLSGRKQYKFFTPELRKIAEDRKRMADDLVTALSENQIQPYFQPQVSARDYSLVGVEALARWKHPTEGFVSPDVFVPLAADLGLLSQLDDMMLRETVAMAQRLNAVGLNIPKVSVNVSLKHGDSELVVKRLEELKPWPCRIVFELLETIDYDLEFERFNPILQKFRDQGIEIELDDFGSGRASITTLLKLRPDCIKLDKQLVSSISNSYSIISPLVKAITEMGLGLKIPMTAEGVEDDIQASTLTGLGCDTLQGFLFSPALPENELQAWIIARNSARTMHSS